MYIVQITGVREGLGITLDHGLSPAHAGLPACKKQSGEQSQISWVYYLKVIRDQWDHKSEIIVCNTSLTTVKFVPLHFFSSNSFPIVELPLHADFWNACNQMGAITIMNANH